MRSWPIQKILFIDLIEVQTDKRWIAIFIEGMPLFFDASVLGHFIPFIFLGK